MLEPKTKRKGEQEDEKGTKRETNSSKRDGKRTGDEHNGNEELMDIVASVGNFDKVAANKMMIEISKSMATVEKKCKKKLTA